MTEEKKLEGGNVWVALLVTIVLIAINGMLASVEIAMMGLNPIKLKIQAEKGDKKSALLLKMKQSPSDFLSTIQIGITLAGLLSGAFAAESLAQPLVRWAQGMGVQGATLALVSGLATFLITLVMTYFMLVFGELVPKRTAMVRPERTARGVCGLINILAQVTKPLVKLLAASTNLVLKLTGVDLAGGEAAVTEDDILLMMQEGHEQGAIGKSEVAFLENVFEFRDLKVKDAMTHRTEVETLSPEDGVAELIDLMGKTGYSKFVVTEGSIDNVVGVVYTKDVINLYPYREDVEALKVRDLMREACFVSEQKKLTELFNEMKESRERMAIVVDEYGGTSGIITLMDILEEMVGDLEATWMEEITPLGEDEYLINGVIEMENVFEFLSLEEEDEYSDTLSGFIIDRLGYVPFAGQKIQIDYQGYTFRVEEVSGGLIRKVHVKRRQEKTE